MFSTPVPVIVVGDLNAMHSTCNCQVANQKRNLLSSFLGHRETLQILSPRDQPSTQRTEGRPDVIDITLHKEVPFDCTSAS